MRSDQPVVAVRQQFQFGVPRGAIVIDQFGIVDEIALPGEQVINPRDPAHLVAIAAERHFPRLLGRCSCVGHEIVG